ncbi:MAG: hypothetical protein GOV00_00380 [Candidatus Altiarchaeota archaeon]|nr:hypothetical protein [Candidatus Altiarchaeota archaeon]
MAYVATYTVADFPNIIFDLLGGIGAYFATEVDSLAGLLFLGLIMAILGWAISAMRGTGKQLNGFIPGLK